MTTTSAALSDMTEVRTDTYVKYVFPPTSDRCVVLDMDDTLCRYDTSLRLPRCHEFQPRETELAIALDAQRNGIDVVIATARPCWTVPKTFSWLRQHNVKARRLYVKNRKNWEVVAHNLKTGMLQDIMQTYTIESFHDDSPFTIRAARGIGVNAVFVPGNEEYWKAKGEAMGWV